MLRGALRLAAGTASLAAGGWCCGAAWRAGGAGSRPAAIRAVAERSPNFRDGVFVNVDPASAVQLRPRAAATAVSGSSWAAAAPRRPRRPFRWPRPASTFDGAAGSSRSAGSGTRRRCWRSTATACSPTRCGVSAAHPRIARARAYASAAGAAGGVAGRRRGGDQPRPLRPPRHRHRPRAGAQPVGAVRRAAGCGRPLARLGHSRASASSNSTGVSAPSWTSSPWSARRHGTSPGAF